MEEVVCYIFIKSLGLRVLPKLGESMHSSEALANNPIYRYKKGVNIPYSSSVSFLSARAVCLVSLSLPIVTVVQNLYRLTSLL